MRLPAFLLLLPALAAAGVAAHELYAVVRQPLPAPVEQVAVASAPSTPQPDSAQPPMRWPALFGEVQPPRVDPPQPPAPDPEPQPPTPAVEPQPPAPPLDSLGYSLRGLVSIGTTRWAVVAHPTGERLLREGDQLAEGITVVAIEPQGLRLDNNGSAAFLEFAE